MVLRYRENPIRKMAAASWRQVFQHANSLRGIPRQMAVRFLRYVRLRSNPRWNAGGAEERNSELLS